MKKNMMTFIVCALLAGCSGNKGGNNQPPEEPTNRQNFPPLTLTSGQSARVILGQNSLVENGFGTSARKFKCSYGVDISSGDQVFIADTCNNRILGFNSMPTQSGVAADFVIGQGDFSSNSSGLSAISFNTPRSVKSGGDKIFVADYNNDRVLIMNASLQAEAGTVAIGQSDLTSNGGNCTAMGLNSPFGVFFGGGKVLVSDFGNGRLLVFNSIPTVSGASADLVIGKKSFDKCSPERTSAQTTSGVAGAWTDGVRLVVADYGHNRVLIWNRFPTSNGQGADLVLGQPDMTSNSANRGGLSASALSRPTAVTSNGVQLFVADSANNRVLVWNSFPKVNNQAADFVLGQTDFKTNTQGTTAEKIRAPYDLSLNGRYLLVADGDNNRTLIFDGSPQPAQ